MGSLPKLKKKDELHYRKGSTNDCQNCEYCVHHIPNILLAYNLRSTGDRCAVMGNQASIRYRVRKDYTCDAQKYNGK